MTRRKRQPRDVDQADRQPRDDAGQPERPRTLFVPRDLDDAGLTPVEFRVYAAMHRRAGDDGVCHESLPRMAARIGLSDRHVRRVVRALERYRLIRRAEVRPGQPTTYRMTPPSAWRLPPPRIVDGDAVTEATPDMGVRGIPAPPTGVSVNGETGTPASPDDTRNSAAAPIRATAVPDASGVAPGGDTTGGDPGHGRPGYPGHGCPGTPDMGVRQRYPQEGTPGEGTPLPTRSHRQHEYSAANAAARATPKAVARALGHNHKPEPPGQPPMREASAHLPAAGPLGDRGEGGARPAGSNGNGNGATAARPMKRFDAPLPPEELARLAQADSRHIVRRLQA